jgi:hypothetical protein
MPRRRLVELLEEFGVWRMNHGECSSIVRRIRNHTGPTSARQGRRRGKRAARSSGRHTGNRTASGWSTERTGTANGSGGDRTSTSRARCGLRDNWSRRQRSESDALDVGHGRLLDHSIALISRTVLTGFERQHTNSGQILDLIIRQWLLTQLRS